MDRALQGVERMHRTERSGQMQAPSRLSGRSTLSGVTGLRRSTRLFGVIGSLGLLLGLAVAPVSAAELFVTTPYPRVAVEPGADLTFPLTVSTDEPRAVALAVEGVPEGWEARLRGGGFTVEGVYADPSQEDPTSVDLSVSVPAEVTSGTFTLSVEATSTDGLSASLPLSITVAEAAAGSVDLTTDFPQLRGAADADFSFSLSLSNDTPQDLTFELVGQGPDRWRVEARPSTENLATSATVEAGGTSTITVDVTPPVTVTAGTYPILVQATAGDRTVEAELQVEITGNFAMNLTTPDERLNTQASAGAAKELQLVVQNTGSAPLENVELEQTSPSGWTIEFRPETVEAIQPGESATVTAVLTPSSEAITGDYVVDFTASTDEVEASQSFRVTIETSLSWALVGVGLIVITLVALGWVFRTYGRR